MFVACVTAAAQAPGAAELCGAGGIRTAVRVRADSSIEVLVALGGGIRLCPACVVAGNGGADGALSVPAGGVAAVAGQQAAAIRNHAPEAH